MNVSIRRADCLEALVTAMEYAADESVELRNRLEAAITTRPSIVWTMTTCRSTLTSPEKRLCSCGTVRETNGWSAVECGLEPLAKG